MYVSLAGLGVWVATHFPSVSHRIALSGAFGFFFYFILPVAVCFLSLLSVFAHTEDGCGVDEMGGAFIITAIFSLLVALSLLIARLPFDHVGVYTLYRFDKVSMFIDEARSANPSALDHPDNAVFALALKDPTPAHIARAYWARENVLEEDEYKKVISALALLGENKREVYVRSEGRGWMGERKRQELMVALRRNPPKSKDLSSNHAAAYLFLVGGEDIVSEGRQ